MRVTNLDVLFLSVIAIICVGAIVFQVVRFYFL